MAVMSQDAESGISGTFPCASHAHSPARTKEDLPEPDAPVTIRNRWPCSVLRASTSSRVSASRPKKMTGPLAEVTLDHFHDEASQKALWDVTAKVTGGVGYPSQV